MKNPGLLFYYILKSILRKTGQDECQILSNEKAGQSADEIL